MSKNIKKYEEFVNELNASTYANVMNKTEQYPWIKKGSGSFVNKDTKRGELNRLAIEKFNDEFYSEFPESETKIFTNKGEYSFMFLNLLSNTNDYELCFEYSGDDKTTEPKQLTFKATTDGYEIVRNFDNVTIIDDDSISLLNDMFKYHTIKNI
jgi:hypothetical protein